MLRRSFLFATAAAIVAGAGTLGAPSVSEAGYYDGKTITVIVGLRAGGTTDRFARSFASFWQKHTPGNPQFVVKNMPGAGALKATNFVAEKAKPDGLTVLWGPWDPAAQALGRKALRTKYEDFGFLGGTGDIRLVYGRTDIVGGGATQAIDLTKAKGIKMGASNPTGMPGLLGRMSLDVLGVPYQFVMGYRGGSGIFAAMKRNEVALGSTSITSFRTRSADFIKQGEGRGYFYLVPVAADGSYKNIKEITEMPSFPDLYKQVHGKMPSGEMWEAFNWLVGLVGRMTFAGFVPKGTPQEAIDDLRKGYAAGQADPEFVAQSVKRFGLPYQFVSAEDGQKTIAALKNASPKVLATLQQVVDKVAK